MKHRSTCLALAAVMLSACGGPAQAPDPVEPTRSTSAAPAAQDRPTPSFTAPPELAEAAFGVEPIDDGSITYQPGVVLVGGGGSMVRSVSEDGLTWTISSEATGIGQVEVGDVMLLTGMVSGRVLSIEDVPEGRAVMLGPVDLPDVIRDARLAGTTSVDLDDATLVVFPESPDAIDIVETDETGGGVPAAARLAVARSTHGSATSDAPGPALIPTPLEGGSAEVGLGGFAVKLKSGALEATYSRNGVDIVLEFGAISDNLRVDAALDVVAGRPTNGRLLVKGLEGFSIRMKAGSTSGLAGNIKARIEVPISMNVPLHPPLYLNLQHKFYVETAFTARNSFITDEAQYDLAGDMGWTMANGAIQLVVPTVTPAVEALDQLEGISLGANGVVFAYQFKPRLGIGSPIFSAGPYAATTISLGLAVGSDAGIRGVKCRQSTVTLDLEGGVGYGWTAGTTERVKGLLERFGLADVAKLESEWRVAKATPYSVSTWEPDVPVCQLSAAHGRRAG